MAFFKWLLERLQEKTTWYGLTAILSSVGVALDPAIADKAAAAGIGVAGLIAVITKEKK